MIKVMFSVNAGDSIAMVLRTRRIAKLLKQQGIKVVYSVAAKALAYLQDYLEPDEIRVNSQDYSITRDAQTDPSAFISGLLRHAQSEMKILEDFRPNIIIGDLGIVAHAYKPDIPILHILNRFFIEISDHTISSPFSIDERNKIAFQTERGINFVREALSKPGDFKYAEFTQAPALINGASYLVDDISSSYSFIGLDMALWPSARTNHEFDSCFVCLGTGLPEYRKQYLSEILKKLERRFKKIYVAYGSVINRDGLYLPRNCVAEPIFRDLPPNIGLLVCHGGYAMIQLGNLLNVPILAFPLHVETYSNADRMEKLGLGVNLGTYSQEAFQGGYEKFVVNWDKFEQALDEVDRVRKVDILENKYTNSEGMLLTHTVELINKLLT